MINDRSDFKYVTPPTGVTIDGDFLATQSQYSQQSKALMWQDIGYLIEATKERDFLCQCAHGNDADPYTFRVDKAIRKQNPINVSKWLYNRYANKGAYPEYAYLGSYLENYDPVWGTPMFLDEDESVEDVLGSGEFVDVTSRTRYDPNDGQTGMDRNNFLAGDEIYRSICAELTGVSREAELSDAHELDPEPIIKLQKNMNKLFKVFYGCYANLSGAASPSQLTIRTRPYLWGIGTSGGTVWGSSQDEEPDVIKYQYSNLGFGNGTSTNWTPYSYTHTTTTRHSGWNQYYVCDGETSLAFQHDNQSKVKSVKLWFGDKVLYYEGTTPSRRDDLWVLTKVNLSKRGSMTLGDGKTYETWQTSGLTDSRPWASRMMDWRGHSLNPNFYEQHMAIYTTYFNFLEVTYEPNTLMNLNNQNQ